MWHIFITRNIRRQIVSFSIMAKKQDQIYSHLSKWRVKEIESKERW